INSPFLRRPVALLPEDGSKLDPRALAEPLAKLLGGEEGETCKSHADACAQLQEGDEELREARAAALKLDYAKATQLVLQALQGLEKLPPARADALSPTGMQYLTKLYAPSGRLLVAVVKTSGFTLEAEADRGQLALRDSLKATVTYRCRKEVECPF